MNERFQRLMTKHLTTPWGMSDKLARAVAILLEAHQKIMQINNAQDMRVLSGKAVRDVDGLMPEK